MTEELDRESVERLRLELEEARRTLAGIHGSRSYRAAAWLSALARRLLPPGTGRRRLVARLLGRPAGPATASPLDAEVTLSRLADAGTTASQGFTVLVLAHRGGDLEATRRALAAQTWKRWRLEVLQPPASGEEVEGAAVAEALGRVPEREMVLLLEAGDALRPDCLHQVAAVVWQDPGCDLVTWDDEGPGGGWAGRLRLRPGWSPETLLSANYLERSFALRAEPARAAAAGLTAAGAAARWELLLGCDLPEHRVSRLPRVLSRAAHPSAVAPAAAVEVVDVALRRRGWAATARWDGSAVRVAWTLPRWPALSVVIPTRHNRRLLGPLLEGLQRSGYTGRLDVVVVDNGPRTEDNQRWYAEQPMRPKVLWWDRPFNYSAVNNAGAAAAGGELLLFLNDDIQVRGEPGWLEELAGWSSVPAIGSVGMQLLDPSGLIQHGGVVLGVTGFAGHLFAGMRPPAPTLLGHTSWYRDVLAVTAACVLVRRQDLEAVGGFEEAFDLCGSDVALGLALRERGLRSLCVPSHALTHLEGATRGTAVPSADYFASWWRYQRWLRAGDPHFHPRLSLQSGAIRLARRGEPSAVAMVAPHLGRSLAVWHSRDDLEGAPELARRCRISPAAVEAVRAEHLSLAGPAPPRSVSWYIPGIDSPFYGGINTALRIADHLAREQGVENRFVVCGGGPEAWVRSGITAAFPRLADAPVRICEKESALERVPAADAAVATLWTTAYQVARQRAAARRYYLVQDFEPMFYPAGSIYALAEESYRLGLYGICNTENLARIYRSYGGTATHFTPAVDGRVFHARGRPPRAPGDPVTLFVYARPGHWRNCWELAEPALIELKERLGDRVRILAAGSWSQPDGSGRLSPIHHLGLLGYAETGELYRRCDLGMALTVSEHPSYLPLELMACGAAVVAFDNPAGGWLLRDGDNCLLAPRTVDGLVDRLEALVTDDPLRERLAAQGLRDIVERHADWDRALEGIWGFLCDPEGVAGAAARAPAVEGTHRVGGPL